MNSFLLLKRHYREKELRLMVASVFLVVFSIVFTHLLYNRLSKNIAERGLSLLGSDRVIESDTIIDKRIIIQAQKIGLSTTKTDSFKTMIEYNSSFIMAEVRAVSSPYPLLGYLRVREPGNEKVLEIKKAPLPGTVFIEQQLLSHLNLSLDDTIKIGNSLFKIAGLLLSEPSKVINLMNFAPLIVMNQADVQKTGLLDVHSSQVNYRLLMTGSNDQLLKLDEWLKSENVLKASDTYMSAKDSIPFISRVLLKLNHYLSAVSAMNLFLSSLLIMIASYHFSINHLKTIAILRCFGAHDFKIMVSYILMFFEIVLFGAFFGVFCGFLLEFILERYFLPETFDVFYPLSVLMNAIGKGCLLVFFLTIVSIIILAFLFSRMSPMLLFKKQAGGSFFLERMQTFFVSRFLKNHANTKTLGSVFHKMARRGFENIFQIIVLSIVLGFSFGIFYMQHDFLKDWGKRLSFDVPNYFVLNISPGIIEPFKKFLIQENQKIQTFYPVTIARLLKVNNKPVSMNPSHHSNDLAWPRLLYITSMPMLKADNTLLEGRWFLKSDQGQALASIEAGFASRLGIRVGDSLEWSVNEKVMKIKVISIRSIQWDTFEPNFLIIVPKGLFDNQSIMYLSSLYVPSHHSIFFENLLNTFPMVSLMDIHMSVSQIRAFVEQACRVLNGVWGLTSMVSFLLCILLIRCSSRQRTQELLLMIIPIGFGIALWIRRHFAQNLMGFL
jgi:putative ABC transport system permease protein